MLAGMFARGAAALTGLRLDRASAMEQALSQNNTRAASTGVGGAKTIYGRRTGKLYFEAVVDTKITTQAAEAILGVLRTDASYLIASKYAYACGVYISGTTGRVWSDGAMQIGLGAPVNGTLYQFAFDLDAKLFWVKRDGGDWNGNASANPATGAGGFGMSDLGGYDVTPGLTSDAAGQQVTFNFDTFAGTLPSGFMPWPSDTTGDNIGMGQTALDSLRRTGMTLSGGGLVATRNASPAIARSPDYREEGRFYFEFTATSVGANGDSCGIASFAATAANLVSDGSNGAIVYRSGNVWSDSAGRGSIGAISSGDRIDVAVDMGSRQIWFRRNGGDWNGNSAASPTNGDGGFPFSYDAVSPAVSLGGSGGGDGNAWTANFGATAFIGVVPEGFTAGWARRHSPLVQYLWTGAVR